MTTPRRSDRVRSRRSDRGPAKKQTAAQRRTTASRAMPPMVTRRGVMTPAPAQRRRSEARRRYNVALPMAAGGQVRLPAMPQVRVGWRLLSFVLTAALSWALYMLWTAPQFHVSAAEVVGLARLNADEVNTVLKVSGASVFTLDPAELEARLQAAFPELQGIRVRVGLPAKVVVEAAERAPVIAWEHEGIQTWVDSSGYSFLPRGQVDGLVPVVAHGLPAPIAGQADQSQQLLTPQMVKAILTLAPSAPEGAPLVFDPEHGLGWADPRGWQVYFGLAPTDMAQRLAVYQAIVKELKAQGIKPTLISVEFLHAPYYRED
ncbi:MAG: FtsQ-type POTRA domain-containing protein [Anaerolineae bacterium]|nr:MAG: FtsQ-type POTRA domain-containing protein [Anaerolineae bacterium]